MWKEAWGENRLNINIREKLLSTTVKKCSRFQITDKKRRETKSYCSLQPSLWIMMGLAGDE